MRQRVGVITLGASLLLASPSPNRADDAGAPRKERRASVIVTNPQPAIDRVHAERTRRRDAETRLEQWRQTTPADAAPSTKRAMEAARGTRTAPDRRSAR